MTEDNSEEVMNEVIDQTQTEVFPDKSVKHVARARKFNFISLDNDAWCAVSFRKYQLRKISPNKESVKVDIYAETTDDDMKNVRKQLVKDSHVIGSDQDEVIDITWDSDSDAKILIRAEWLTEPVTIEVIWKWWNGSTSRSARQASVFYRAEEWMPTYADLSEDEQVLAVSILNRFSLLRDNHYGNGMPNLAEDVQTAYSLEDVAQEMHIALSRINMTAIQPTNFILGSDSGEHFPKAFYNYLMTVTMSGLVRKFVYGYLETPDINGNTGVAYADRKQYYNKWRQEQATLEEDSKTLEAAFKRATLNLTASSVLVGGGMFGGSGGGIFTNRMVHALESGYQSAFFLPLDITTASTN